MRANILCLLRQLKNNHKQNIKMGLYPPKLNLSKSQTDTELYSELRKFIDYLERPYYSHLNKFN